MSREIKFRAWNKIVERYQYFTLPDIEVQKGKIRWELLVIEQFTGLKDKNGKDVYEGDILKGGIFASYEVKWDGENTTFNLSEYNVREAFEVIGNIHEEQSKPTP